MYLRTERPEKTKMKPQPKITTAVLLNRAKHNKKRVITTAKSSDNRESRRAVAKQSYRCDNNGNPSGRVPLTLKDWEKFKQGRQNKAIVKSLNRAVKNGITFSKKAMVEAEKILKKPKKYSEEEVSMATALVTRLGKYRGLVCVEDQLARIQKVGA